MANGIRLSKPVKSLREIRNRNVVKQSLDFSCGAAGLSTVLHYFLGDPVTEKEIIAGILQTVDLNKVKQRHGFSLKDLKGFAESRGYKVTGYKMDFDFLHKLDKPVLVPIKFKNYRHFVIVKGVVGDRVFLADPAMGNISMKIHQFEAIWNGGVGLVVEHQDGSSTDIARVKVEDALFADYGNILRTIQGVVYRTTVHPNEY